MLVYGKSLIVVVINCVNNIRIPKELLDCKSVTQHFKLVILSLPDFIVFLLASIQYALSYVAANSLNNVQRDFNN